MAVVQLKKNYISHFSFRLTYFWHEMHIHIKETGATQHIYVEHVISYIEFALYRLNILRIIVLQVVLKYTLYVLW